LQYSDHEGTDICSTLHLIDYGCNAVEWNNGLYSLLEPELWGHLQYSDYVGTAEEMDDGVYSPLEPEL
jgi:hypothetical protein